MHKLIEYVCDELEALEKKADKGKLSMTEIEYADKLAHLKKNLLKGDELYEEMDAEYSGAMYPMADGMRGSYARGRGRNARRDSMGRYSSEYGYSRESYSRAGHDMADKLHELMEEAPDESTRRDIERLLHKVEQMR